MQVKTFAPQGSAAFSTAHRSAPKLEGSVEFRLHDFWYDFWMDSGWQEGTLATGKPFSGSESVVIDQ